MNKTAELVRLWAKFEEQNEGAEIEDFCQAMLLAKNKQDDKFLGGVVPADVYGKIAKTIGRISKLHSHHAQMALKVCGINNFEDFIFLNTIHVLKNANKTEVITRNFSELSSGLLILERLKQNGFITEQTNNKDKRSKILTTTAKGTKVLKEAYEIMSELNESYFGALKAEDIELCIKLIAPVEMKLSEIWTKNKKKI